jgi:hypothetical protein
MPTSYPRWDRVLVGLRLADAVPATIPRPKNTIRPPSDLAVIAYEDHGFPVLSWQWSPDDRLCLGGSYGVRYRQLAPGPYGIVVPAPVWVSSAGPAHRTIWDVYGCCIFGGTYEVSVSFVPPDRPASPWSDPIEVLIPEAF